MRIKRIFIGFFLITGVLFICLIPKIYSAYIFSTNADLTLIEKPIPSIIYDKNSKEITSIGYDNWEDEIPNHIKNAFISIEDKRFYEHCGVDFIRLAKVSISRLLGKNNGGASTITQQLVKNIFLTPERSIDRKLKEIFLSLRVERNYSKNEIIESYLNNIYFGNGNHGIRSASMDYFNKKLGQLSNREAAMLAAIINNPNWYDLRKSMYKTQDMTNINKRTNLCILLMKKNGYLSDNEAKKAYKDGVFISKEKRKNKEKSVYNHAHYIEYAIYEATSEYLKINGIKPTPKSIKNTKDLFFRRGYKIYTNLDRGVQKHLEDTVQNYKYPVAKNGTNAEVASIISENNTGKIVAMIGSRYNPVQYYTFNRAVYSKTPVASILKPIAIYGPAYDLGKNMDDLVLNEKVKIDGYDDYELYPPGKLLREGMVSYKYSLDHSLNIPAGRILVDVVGYDKATKYLEKLGINKTEIINSGQGFVLGTSGIPLIKILRGYQSISNDGVYIEQTTVNKILNKNNEVLYQSNPQKYRVYSKEGSKKLKENLRSVVTSGTGYACNNSDVYIAGKTGTHEDKLFNFAGFSKKYNGIVWIGTDDNSSFHGNLESQDVAAPLFLKIFMYFKGEENTDSVIIS